MSKAWILLLVASGFEILWALGLKLSEGFTRPVPTVLTVLAMAGTYVFLGLAIKSIPLGTAYAIWTGIGAVGTAALGILLFGESSAPTRLFFIALIVTGIVGLKLSTPPHPATPPARHLDLDATTTPRR